MPMPITIGDFLGNRLAIWDLRAGTGERLVNWGKKYRVDGTPSDVEQFQLKTAFRPGSIASYDPGPERVRAQRELTQFRLCRTGY